MIWFSDNRCAENVQPTLLMPAQRNLPTPISRRNHHNRRSSAGPASTNTFWLPLNTRPSFTLFGALSHGTVLSTKGKFSYRKFFNQFYIILPMQITIRVQRVVLFISLLFCRRSQVYLSTKLNLWIFEQSVPSDSFSPQSATLSILNNRNSILSYQSL